MRKLGHALQECVGTVRAQDVALPPVDQRLEVGQRALLEQGVEDAPIGAVPRDQDHS